MGHSLFIPALLLYWAAQLLPGQGQKPAGSAPAVSVPVASAHMVRSRLQRGELCVMWYNVENLFHPEDDTLASDDPFTPGGSYHWTDARYRKKLTAIAKVIIAAGQWQPPDLVGLCEVESHRVLEDLVGHPLLVPWDYRFLHRDSPDRRGMDVACLYREGRVLVSEWKTIRSVAPGTDGGTRDILYLCGVWGKGDTLDLLLAHLVSRYSGAGATAGRRKRQVSQLARLSDSVRTQREGGLTLLAGDFNDEPGAFSMEPLETGNTGYDPILQVPMDGPGSYKYQGRWSTIDRFMVSGQLKSYRLEGSILQLPALLTPDETYGGMKPFRTYSGYAYFGGISDHLPIILDISRRSFLSGSGR